MQIIKGDRNSQLKKDEETHLRRMNPQRSMAQMLKTSLKSRAPLRWGIVVGNALVGRHHGCSGEVPCNIQSKEETGERKRTRTRCQGPARGLNTNDDDETLVNV